MKLKLWVGSILIFLMGGLCGSLVTGRYIKHRLDRFVMGQPPGVVVLNALTRRLDLTPDQAEKMDHIRANARKRFDAFHRENTPKIEQLIADSLTSIREILTPAQEKRFNAMLEQMEKKRFFAMVRDEGNALRYPRRLMKRLKVKLELTEDQTRDVAKILKARAKRQRKWLERNQDDAPDHDAFRAYREKEDQRMALELKGVLTPEQFQRYILLRERIGEGRMAPPPRFRLFPKRFCPRHESNKPEAVR